MKRTMIRVGRILAVMAALGIVGQPFLAATASADSGDEVRVDIDDKGYDETAITIDPGVTVRWRNKDKIPHSVTPDVNGAFPGTTISPDGEYTVTFTKSGDYPYHDIYSSYRGTIHVTGSISSPGPSPTPAPAPAPGPATVRIGDDFFSPTSVTVLVGSKITWSNGGSKHTTTSDSGLWDSGILNTGGAFSHTFNQPGTYLYHCELHAKMTGAILVTDGDNAPPPPAPTPTPAPTPAPAPAPASAPGSAGVTVGDNFFNPDSVTVLVGSTVTWSFSGASKHTTTSVSGLWDSGILGSGSQFSFKFSTPGTFPYRCDIHPEMTGTIIATDGVNEPPPAAPAATTPAPAAAASSDPSDALHLAADVNIGDNFFIPEDATIAVGGTVTWTNAGQAIHTVTSETGLFDSGYVKTGGTFSQRFDTAGEYRYVCTIHPGMAGRVLVLADSGDDASGNAAAPAQDDTSTSERTVYSLDESGLPLLPRPGDDAAPSDTLPLVGDSPWPAAAIPLALAGVIVAGLGWALVREKRSQARP